MNKIKSIAITLIFLFFVSSAIYKVIKRNRTETGLDKNTSLLTGVIVDKKNYLGNSPVSQSFTYSYEFKINGKIYTNDSHDPNLKVGDSLKILYNTTNPKFNKPFSSSN